VIAIRTVGELRQEGREMGHCVATYASAVLEGKCYVYRARVGARRFTVELDRDGDAWRLAQVSAAHNRRPTRREWAALARWVAIPRA